MTQFRGIIERAYNTFDPTPSEAQYQHKASNAAGLFLTWTKKIWNTFIFCFPLLFWLGETREKEQKNLNLEVRHENHWPLGKKLIILPAKNNKKWL